MTAYISDTQARDFEQLALIGAPAGRNLFGTRSARRHARRHASIDTRVVRALSRPANSVHAWLRAGQL